MRFPNQQLVEYLQPIAITFTPMRTLTPRQVSDFKVLLTAMEVGRLLEEEPARVEEYESSGTSDVWQTFRMLSVDGEPAGFAR